MAALFFMALIIRNRQRKCWQVFVIAVSLSLSNAPMPSADAADSIQPLKSAYNSGDYAIAVRLGRELTGSQPGNALAHYYVANALVRLSLPDQAILEYQKCIEINKSDVVGVNAARGILVLQQGQKTNFKDSSANPARAPGRESGKEKNWLSQSDARRLQELAAREEKNASERYDQDVKQLQRQSLSDEELKLKSREAFQKLQVEQAKIESRYKAMADEQSKRGANVDSTSSTRMVPHGSNTYVQNFENLGSDSDDENIPTENPLLAKAKSLTLSKVKKPAAKKLNSKKVSK